MFLDYSNMTRENMKLALKVKKLEINEDFTQVTLLQLIKTYHQIE